MAAKSDKCVLLFFKKINCPPCLELYNKHWTHTDGNKEGPRLVTDPDLAGVVEFRYIEFGQKVDARGNKINLTFTHSYPDMTPVIRYAPFLWLHPPGNRAAGIAYGSSGFTFDQIKAWILERVTQFSDVTVPSGVVRAPEAPPAETARPAAAARPVAKFAPSNR